MVHGLGSCRSRFNHVHAGATFYTSFQSECDILSGSTQVHVHAKILKKSHVYMYMDMYIPSEHIRVQYWPKTSYNATRIQNVFVIGGKHCLLPETNVFIFRCEHVYHLRQMYLLQNANVFITREKRHLLG